MTAPLHPRGTLRNRFEPVAADVFRRLGIGARSCDLGDEGLYLAEELVAADVGWLGSGEHPEALAILVLVLMIAQRQGSTRLPLDPKGPLRTLVADVARLAGIELDVPRVVRTIVNLTKAPRFNSVIGVRGARLPLVVEDDALYTERARWLEARVAARLAERIAQPALSAEGVQAIAARVATQSTRMLSDEQRRAVEIALANRISVVTGGPGTGKTLVAAAIVRGFAAMEIPNIALAAQTGKAANRLTEVIGEQGVQVAPAQTLHRLLGYRSGSRSFAHHAQSPLPVGAVIVDEASMIDLELVDALLDALPATAPLVLIGDAHQLPAIDAGQVLTDLTVDKFAATVVARLEKSYRQNTSDPDGLAVYQAAKAINDGDPARLFESRRSKSTSPPRDPTTADRDPTPEGSAPPDRDDAPPPTEDFAPPLDREDVPPRDPTAADRDPPTPEGSAPPDRDDAPPPTEDFAPPLDREDVPPPTEEFAPPLDREDVPPPTEEFAPPLDREDVPPPTEEFAPPLERNEVAPSTMALAPPDRDDVPPPTEEPLSDREDVPLILGELDALRGPPPAGARSKARTADPKRSRALAVPRLAHKLVFRGVEWVDTSTSPRPHDVTLAVADALWLHLDGPKALRTAERVFRFVEGRVVDGDRAELEALWSLLARGRVLTVTRTLPTGSVAINQHIHQQGLDRLSVTGRPDFIPGEPVMVTANDYQRGLFNGDQGIIVRADEGLGRHHYRAVFRQGGELRPFAIEALRDRLELAWALTIHKSQGSELDAIALLLPHDDIPLVTRELLYTGITRARKCVILAGAKPILINGGKRAAQRHSGLGARLRATLK